MNPNIQKLYEIARKKRRVVLGLMSGTSLDGLDVALCEISGSGQATSLKVLHFRTTPYDHLFKTEIRKTFSRKEIDFQHLCVLNPYIAEVHAGMILDCLDEWGIAPGEVDLIASHGQTMYHAPASQHQLPGFPNATLQIGDGDHLAVRTGIITVSDFRQKHIAAGGEGAPLAVYGDYLLFADPLEDRILLNIGGIANFTMLPAGAQTVTTSDTGPGNVLIDAFARHFFDLPYDEGGEIAAKGRVHDALLKQLKKNAFFDGSFPKTTGPELFNLEYLKNAQLRSGATSVLPDDMMATLTHFTAETIADAIRAVAAGETTYRIYVSGGGANNLFLMKLIQEQLPSHPVSRIEALGYSGEAKEALLFALLANEAVSGNAIALGPGAPAVSLGKFSFPG